MLKPRVTGGAVRRLAAVASLGVVSVLGPGPLSVGAAGAVPAPHSLHAGAAAALSRVVAADRLGMHPLASQPGSVYYNWSGYSVQGTSGLTSMAGCWTEPAVTPASGDSYAWASIAVDGVTDQNMLMVGTAADWYQGEASYIAFWYSGSTNTGANIDAVVVKPGDSMCAGLAAGAAGNWTVTVTDESTGEQYSTAQPYQGPLNAASWLLLNPQYPSSPLMGFGQVTFDKALLDGGNPHFTLADSIEMVDQSGNNVIAYPSPPDADTDGFTVTYTAGVSLATPSAYQPLAPYRICDTRAGSGTSCSGVTVGPGAVLDVQVTGVPGPAGQQVPSGATAAVLNVTAIQSTAATYLTLYPPGGQRPTASNLNVTAGAIQANLVVVALSSGGQVAIYNAQGSINVAVDVEGYFSSATASAGPGLFHPIPPQRTCDTRSGSGFACSPLGAGQWEKLVVSTCLSGASGCSGQIPGDGTAEAAVLNLTAVQPSQGTFLSVAPTTTQGVCPTGAPGFSNLNVVAGTILPNRVIVPLGPDAANGPDRDVCVFNSLGTVNVVVDLNGWFGTGSETSPGARFYSIPPLRLCDTRGDAGTGYVTECSGVNLTQGGAISVAVAGAYGLPAAEQMSTAPVAMIANVTAVDGSTATYLTLYPSDFMRPLASDLNVGPGQVVPNLAIVQLAAPGNNGGEVDVFNAAGRIDVVIDLAGWFQP
ncbi:MAG TPA: G1 family glutamic endopeptidase [Candidatus Binatia bacterium]|nr:G1 family glutamic endopeptidase [Candidatus Binatia bacterium]